MTESAYAVCGPAETSRTSGIRAIARTAVMRSLRSSSRTLVVRRSTSNSSKSGSRPTTCLPHERLAAGHIDEVYLHVVPVLLGSGTRLFDQPDREPIQLRLIDVTQGAKASHQRYEVVSDRAR